MKTRIVRIGNSHGIRIPKPILETAGLSAEVRLEVAEGCLIVHPIGQPREGWDEHFAAMSEVGDDQPLDAETIETSTWDEAEWEW